MHPSLLAGFAALVAASFWLLTRRRPPVGMALDGQAIAALNRAQIALVSTAAAAASEASDAREVPSSVLPLPATARERATFPRRLTAQMAGSAAQRLAAMEAAALWGDRASLPVLSLGLRDVDPQVVRAAALAMERFRGRSSGGRCPGAQAPAALPRNVARTR